MNLTIDTIRLWNARYLADQLGSIVAFGSAIGKSQGQAGNLIGKNPVRNIGNSIAREIEEAFKKTNGWIDHAHPDLWAAIKNKEWKAALKKEFGDELSNLFRVMEPAGSYDVEKTNTDIDLFASIIEAVSEALDNSGIELSTKEILEVSRLFYDMEIKQPPKKAVVIDLVKRLKMTSAGG